MKFHAAAISQDLKDVMRLSDGWQSLRPDVREALDRVQSSIGRILAGDDGAKISDMLSEALDVCGGKNDDDICGLCGLPGADKIPHPVYWPGEARPNRPYVHEDCEDEACERAQAAHTDRARAAFLGKSSGE